jgi:exonuclease III
MVRGNDAVDRPRPKGPKRSGDTLVLTTANVAGVISQPRKQQELTSLMHGNAAISPADIIGLQEVKHHNDRDLPLAAEEQQMLADNVAPGCRSAWTAYVGICVTTAIDHLGGQVHTALNGRVMLLSLRGLDVLVIYAPGGSGADGSAGRARKKFYTELNHLLSCTTVTTATPATAEGAVMMTA